MSVTDGLIPTEWRELNVTCVKCGGQAQILSVFFNGEGRVKLHCLCVPCRVTFNWSSDFASCMRNCIRSDFTAPLEKLAKLKDKREEDE